MSIRLGFLSLALVAMMAGSANASLLGQTITCSGNLFQACDPASAVVAAGPEFTLENADLDPVYELEVGANSITMVNVTEGSLGNFDDALTVTLGDLVWSDDPSATITGISGFFASNVSGLGGGDITTGANSVVIDYSLTDWQADAFIRFDLVTSHDAGSTEVPEPASLALFTLALAGLAALVFFGWRRRRANPASA